MATGLYQDLDIVVSISADTGIVTSIDMVLDSSITMSDTFYAGFGLGGTVESSISINGDILINLDGTLTEDLNTLFTNTGVTGTLGSVVITQDTTLTLSNFNIDGVLVEVLDSTLLLNGGINSTGDLVETLTTIVQAIGTITSSFGDLDADITSLCMNTRTFGISEYSKFNFNSFFNIGSRYYGCCYDGVFEITGDTDRDLQQIQAIVKTGVSNFESQKLKAVKDCYVYIRSSGENTLRLIINEQIDRAGYLIPYDYIDGMHRRRIKVAQGLRGTSWQAEFKNEEGVDFTLKQIDLMPVELARSI